MAFMAKNPNLDEIYAGINKLVLVEGIQPEEQAIHCTMAAAGSSSRSPLLQYARIYWVGGFLACQDIYHAPRSFGLKFIQCFH